MILVHLDTLLQQDQHTLGGRRGEGEGGEGGERGGGKKERGKGWEVKDGKWRGEEKEGVWLMMIAH